MAARRRLPCSRVVQAEQGSELLDLSFGSSPAVLTPALAAASCRRRPPLSLSLSREVWLELGFWVWGVEAEDGGSRERKEVGCLGSK